MSTSELPMFARRSREGNGPRFGWLAAFAATVLSVGSARGATIVVTDPGDALHSPGCATTGTGACTLRDAVTFANAHLGQDAIGFAIPGPGVHVIALQSVLPAIIDFEGVTIDGYTQPGASENTSLDSDNAVILIDLRAAPLAILDYGLKFAASSGNDIRGLAIGGFSEGVLLDGGGFTSPNRIRGNFIGLDPTGVAPNPNNTGISVRAASLTLIGGAASGDRNIISANHEGILLNGSIETRIVGNFIGLDATGLARAGGAVAQDIGVFLQSGVNDRVGGELAGERNVIGGNLVGVYVTNNAGGAAILGNWIGLDAKGIGPVGNEVGVSLQSVFPSCVCVAIAVGGAGGAGNVISGNAFGVSFSNHESVLIAGNWIGTNPAGLVAVPNGTGIIATFISDFELGGAATIQDNIVSGNTGEGIRFSNVSGLTVRRNSVGISANGAPLGNGGSGISILSTSHHNVVGGPSPDGNTIANNGGAGVFVGSAASDASAANRIVSNILRSNAGLGIDLFPAGVAPNDPGDADSGPNGLQNFPALSRAVRSTAGDRFVISGSQVSSPSSGAHELQFFVSDGDATGYGEGKALLYDLSDSASGSFDFTTPPFTPPVALGASDRITATATTLFGTSEFSQAIPIVGNEAPVAVAGPDRVILQGTVVLDGSASSDPDGLPRSVAISTGSFVWTQIGGPSVVLSNPDSARPYFVAQVPGVYVFSLVVSDGLDVSAASPVTITVTAAPAAIGVPAVGAWGLAILIAALALAGASITRRAS